MKEMKTLTFPNGETYEVVDDAARQALNNKSTKVQIDYEGNKVFKYKGEQLNFKQIYDYHITSPDFTFIVYGNRAYLCSFIDIDGTIKEMRFDSTINSNGVTKVSSIYLTSLDGVAINTATVSDINSENTSNKSQTIDDSTTKYPSNKAVKDFVDAHGGGGGGAAWEKILHIDPIVEECAYITQDIAPRTFNEFFIIGGIRNSANNNATRHIYLGASHNGETISSIQIAQSIITNNNTACFVTHVRALDDAVFAEQDISKSGAATEVFLEPNFKNQTSGIVGATHILSSTKRTFRNTLISALSIETQNRAGVFGVDTWFEVYGR